MGGGSWDPGTYTRNTQSKISSGTTFGYTTQTSTTSRSTWAAHDDLDPKKVAGPSSPLAGQIVRESRDTTEHPTSTPVAVFFDETGSMHQVPRVLQTKLALLEGIVLRKGYLEHPQFMMGAYGDGYTDRVALQVSQFESDNRIDDALDNLFLEGNGGGNGGENQNLAWYYVAHHTVTDAWEKRSKKGYAFFIGDESTNDLTAKMVQQFVGDGEPLGALDNESVVKALLEKWEAYVFVIDNLSAKSQHSIEHYTALFGKDRVLVVENEEAISESIALVIGMTEGVIDLDDGVDDLKAVGASDSAISQTRKALAHLSGSTGAMVQNAAPADLDAADDDAVTTV